MSKDGGPAFPYSALTPDGPVVYADSQGMTLRDYFAAKAMQGWIASAPKVMGESLDGSPEMAEAIAMSAYVYADAMLAEREKT